MRISRLFCAAPRPAFVILALVVTGALVAPGVSRTAPPQRMAATVTPMATVADIANLANAQVGNDCRPYTTLSGQSACANWWCAVFASWVWRHAGVPDAPDTWVATDTAVWGQQRGLFKPRPAGGIGNPQPGDMVVYGQPGASTGGHVGIVYSVNSNGTITTIDGDYNGSTPTTSHVFRDTVNPVSARSGASNWLISGYVSPPGVTPPYVPQPGDFVNGGIDDLSGDGHADLMFRAAGSVQYLPNNSGSNPGGVPFAGNSVQVAATGGSDLVACADVSGDGHADLMIYMPATDSVGYLPNNSGNNPGGTPFAGNAVTVATHLGGGVTHLMLADLTGDGYADLVYTKPDGSIWYLPNNMGATPDHLPFSNEAAVQIVSGLPASAIVTIGDVTGDHYADLLFVSDGSLYYLPNNILATGNGLPFTGAATIINQGSFGTATQLVAADVSGDGYADLLWTNGNATLYYLPNNLHSNPGNAFFYGDSATVAALGTTFSQLI